MKQRNCLVSNSSSCSFMISNKSDKELTIVDFVKENPQLIEKFKEEYDSYKDDPEYIQENLIKSAEERLKQTPQTFDHISNYIIPAKRRRYLSFGDEHGDLIGKVFDYILRDGGSSENFEWYLESINR